MTSAQLHSHDSSRIGPGITAAIAGGGALALIFMPGVVARVWPGAWGADPDRLGGSFADFVGEGGRHGAGLQGMVAYWQGFHVVKALLAIVLVVVLTRLAVLAWRRTAVAPRALSRAGFGVLAAVVSTAAMTSLVIAAANIQGVFAPLSSVLSLLPLDGSDARASAAAAGLLAELQTGGASAPLQLLVSDFRDYHAVMAVVAAVCAAGLLAVSIVLLVRRARSPRTERRVRRVFALNAWVLPAFAMFFGVVALANLSSAEEPAAALLEFFASGGAL
ncbi:MULTISPECIES: hypothetical protein [unclassified Microbacterium]|uniref:hypothetical protein n=1 Tax=unclassified Microbacterium TaxID=2609290 RepID=UPI0030175014